jgi:hypothetical protein
MCGGVIAGWSNVHYVGTSDGSGGGGGGGGDDSDDSDDDD